MDRVIIGTSPRTGSNLLIDSLAEHPRAASTSELFNPDIPCREEYNLAKLFSHDVVHEDFWEVLSSASHVIYLYRINTERQKASWERACRTGRWVVEAEPEDPCPTPDMDFWIHRAEEIFLPRATIAVSYEYMISEWNTCINRVLNTIGWEPMYLPQMRTKMKYPN